MPLPPPFSTISWWSCVCRNCRCTNTGRILRFWQREWYILPQRRYFQPVEAGQGQPERASLVYSNSRGTWTTQEEAFATLELTPKRSRFHFEYRMSVEAETQHEDLRRGDENSYVTFRVRAEPDDGSTVPPSYDSAVGKEGSRRSRVFVDYYLVERADREDGKKGR